MSAPYNTLLLDQTTWDLTVDAAGNIAMAAPPYALAQDVSCQCKLFKGELYYDTTQGVPYFQSGAPSPNAAAGQQNILGALPPLQFVKAQYVAAAKLVPGVVAAVCYVTSIVNRVLSGQVQSTDTAGRVNASGF